MILRPEDLLDPPEQLTVFATRVRELNGLVHRLAANLGVMHDSQEDMLSIRPGSALESNEDARRHTTVMMNSGNGMLELALQTSLVRNPAKAIKRIKVEILNFTGSVRDLGNLIDESTRDDIYKKLKAISTSLEDILTLAATNSDFPKYRWGEKSVRTVS